MFRVIYKDKDFLIDSPFRNEEEAIDLATELAEESGYVMVVHDDEVIFERGEYL